jgi:hypothetical protein
MNKRSILLIGLGLVLGALYYNNRKRTLMNGSEVKVDTSSECEKKWNSKAETDKGAIGATREARKQYFMYNCVNNIAPQVIMN